MTEEKQGALLRKNVLNVKLYALKSAQHANMTIKNVSLINKMPIIFVYFILSKNNVRITFLNNN